MASNFRHQEIVSLARQLGRVTVEELATRYGVTPQTIRKDLNELCDQRILTRTHGGAILASGVENVAYEARRKMAEAEKQRIAARAAALIPHHSSLFINIGTTTEEVARHLTRHEGLLVITNNIHVASRPSISSASSRSTMPSSASPPSTRKGRCSISTIARFAPPRRSSKMPAR